MSNQRDSLTQLTAIETKMANWLLQYDRRLKEYGDREYGEQGSVFLAAARVEFALSCAFSLIGTGGIAISKLHGPIAGITLLFYGMFLIAYVSGIRRLRAAKRYRSKVND